MSAMLACWNRNAYTHARAHTHAMFDLFGWNSNFDGNRWLHLSLSKETHARRGGQIGMNRTKDAAFCVFYRKSVWIWCLLRFAMVGVHWKLRRIVESQSLPFAWITKSINWMCIVQVKCTYARITFRDKKKKSVYLKWLKHMHFCHRTLYYMILRCHFNLLIWNAREKVFCRRKIIKMHHCFFFFLSLLFLCFCVCSAISFVHQKKSTSIWGNLMQEHQFYIHIRYNKELKNRNAGTIGAAERQAYSLWLRQNRIVVI